jgi:hypothetical protein
MSEQKRIETADDIIRYLKQGGSAGFAYDPTFLMRVKCAWLSFRTPMSLARAGCIVSAQMIERGEALIPELANPKDTDNG